MYISEQASKKQIYLLRLLVLALIGVTVYALNALHDSEKIYQQISDSVSAQSIVAKKTQIGDATINIPNYDMFKPGRVWALVSKKHPLKGEAGYTLIDIPVAHGDQDKPMKVAKNISDRLQQLVNAAEADGEPLMVSSAYRSLKDQQELRDEFVKENGEAAAKQYVSPVGASEHHTGLAVDLSSLSDECAADSNSCSLSQSGAAWLAKNAYRFGFIQRYPSGKQEVTGVGYEPWHYRYVGIPLAKAMAGSGLTFDEVVAQLAPGYAQ